MLSNRVITVSIEGLSTYLLGPYGSSTAVTPNLDHFAAHGMVLDECFLDSRTLPEIWSSLWRGRHALQSLDASSRSLWHLVEEAGGMAMLITDCATTAQTAEQMGCSHVILLELQQATQPAEDSSECQMMALVSEAANLIQDFEPDVAPPVVLVWIHSRGLRQPWDAPLALRQQFTDPDDPDPPDQVHPPSMKITTETDPDWIVGWGQAAAAQVAVIDQAIGFLHDFLSRSSQTWSWCLIGLGGMPLGEHGWLGWGEPQLYGEELQVPVIVVPHPPLPVGSRRAELCQLPDVAATIAELSGLTWPEPIWGHSQLNSSSIAPPTHWPPAQQTIGLVYGRQKWIRVPGWSLTFDDQNTTRLYVKPDDRWEVSEVSSRCADTVASLRALADKFLEVTQSGRREELPELSDDLCNLLR